VWVGGPLPLPLPLPLPQSAFLVFHVCPDLEYICNSFMCCQLMCVCVSVSVFVCRYFAADFAQLFHFHPFLPLLATLPLVRAPLMEPSSSAAVYLLSWQIWYAKNKQTKNAKNEIFCHVCLLRWKWIGCDLLQTLWRIICLARCTEMCWFAWCDEL